MLENALQKPKDQLTTKNELAYEAKKKELERKQNMLESDMILADSGTSMANKTTNSAFGGSVLANTQTSGFTETEFENPVFKMQEHYLKELDDQYEFLQSSKKAKKFQILRSIRMLQKFWRFHFRMKRKITCNKIGSWYKYVKQNKSQIK